MTLLAQFGHIPSAVSPVGAYSALARSLGADAPGLAVFRNRASHDYERSLSTLIESEIIPRLMIAHATEAYDAQGADHARGGTYMDVRADLEPYGDEDDDLGAGVDADAGLRERVNPDGPRSGGGDRPAHGRGPADGYDNRKRHEAGRGSGDGGQDRRRHDPGDGRQDGPRYGQHDGPVQGQRVGARNDQRDGRGLAQGSGAAGGHALAPASGAADVRFDRDEAVALASLVLDVEADALLSHIEAILGRGVSVDAVMVDLLAPTARLLGEYWEADRCDFVAVTMGLWRLQEVVHEIAARAPAERLLAAGGHRALFASMPGDRHNFGTVVIDELFRRDGWITDRLHGVETAELVKRVGDDWFDLVGLTVSCECYTANLKPVLGALRNVSRNPQLCIMVGGPVFSAAPERAAAIGADGTARDARVALKVAADLVRLREREISVIG